MEDSKKSAVDVTFVSYFRMCCIQITRDKKWEIGYGEENVISNKKQ